jgi:hypothetical protein
MGRRFTPEGLQKHGFTIQQVMEWQERECKAGRDSGFDDFCRAHGMCVECGGRGTLVVGLRWREEDGTERSARGPLASLDSKNWLTDVLKWDYLYEPCGSCSGLGITFGRSTGKTEVMPDDSQAASSNL